MAAAPGARRSSPRLAASSQAPAAPTKTESVQARGSAAASSAPRTNTATQARRASAVKARDADASGIRPRATKNQSRSSATPNQPREVTRTKRASEGEGSHAAATCPRRNSASAIASRKPMSLRRGTVASGAAATRGASACGRPAAVNTSTSASRATATARSPLTRGGTVRAT